MLLLRLATAAAMSLRSPRVWSQHAAGRRLAIVPGHPRCRCLQLLLLLLPRLLSGAGWARLR